MKYEEGRLRKVRVMKRLVAVKKIWRSAGGGIFLFLFEVLANSRSNWRAHKEFSATKAVR